MNQHWQALGWTLVHFLWQGAAIALVYRVFNFALGRRSANARYVLALAALVAMLGVSLATLAYEEARVHPAALPAGNAGQTARTTLPTEDAGPAASTHLAAQFPVVRFLPFLDALWFAGVFFLTVRAFGGWWFLRRLRLSAFEPAPKALLLRLDMLRFQLGIRRLVDLRLSRRIVNPLTAGVFRPWILLPIAAIAHLAPEQIEVILSHELAHIRRRDYLWNIVQTIIETLFFFHPAVWWISRRAREERELCCDDAALARCSDPSVYASALLRLEEERRNQVRLAMALDGHQSRAGLRARILRILGDPDPSPRSVRPLSLAGMAIAIALFFCPMPRVFASLRAVPAATSSITHAVSTATHAALRSAIRPHVATAAAAQSGTAHAGQAKPSPAQPAPQSTPEPAPDAGHSDYIDQMRAAGYNVDIDKYVAMKLQGITAAYAREMAEAVGSQLTADNLIAAKVQGITPEVAAEIAKALGSSFTINDLIAMKVQGVTPDYMAQLKAAGYEAPVHQLIGMKVQGVTPEYAEAMSKAGLGKPSANQLIALKVQGVTPEYAAKLHNSGIEVSSFNDLISDRIFEVTPEFVAQMKDAGFRDIPSKKLIELRVQGVTPDFARKVKAQFPDATVNELVQMRIFHIDSAFIADAQRHGFAPLTIEKLVRLRISGILDETSQSGASNDKEKQP
jgi:beta-lactamase regulating signal transducer with metallopeptidase domain